MSRDDPILHRRNQLWEYVELSTLSNISIDILE